MASITSEEQFRQFMLLQQQMNKNQSQLGTTDNNNFGSKMHQQKVETSRVNTSVYPDPKLPFEIDEYGCPVYTSAPHGLDHTRNQLYSVYEPHIPYLYYSDVTKNKHAGPVVYVNAYKGAGIPPRIQLCGFNETPLRSPFGAQVGKSKDGKQTGDPNRPNFDLTIENDTLLQFLKKWDEKNINVAIARIERFFKEDTEPAAVKTLYRRIVMAPNKPKLGEPKKDFKPTLRTKVVLSGQGATRVFIKTGENSKGGWVIEQVSPNLVTLDLLKKGVRCIPIVDVTGMWFMSQVFGMSFQCTDIIIVPRADRKAADFCGIEIEVQTQSNARLTNEDSSRICGQDIENLYEEDDYEDTTMYLNSSTPVDQMNN